MVAKFYKREGQQQWQRYCCFLTGSVTAYICVILFIHRNEQLLPFKAARFRLLCNCSILDATVLPPYMEANIQQGIIDTPQLHGSTTRVAQWGDVLTNLQQRFNGPECWAWTVRFQVQTTAPAVWIWETYLTLNSLPSHDGKGQNVIEEKDFQNAIQ